MKSYDKLTARSEARSKGLEILFWALRSRAQRRSQHDADQAGLGAEVLKGVAVVDLMGAPAPTPFGQPWRAVHVAPLHSSSSPLLLDSSDHWNSAGMGLRALP